MGFPVGFPDGFPLRLGVSFTRDVPDASMNTELRRAISESVVESVTHSVELLLLPFAPHQTTYLAAGVTASPR